jgi:hypothetical protein
MRNTMTCTYLNDTEIKLGIHTLLDPLTEWKGVQDPEDCFGGLTILVMYFVQW